MDQDQCSHPVSNVVKVHLTQDNPCVLNAFCRQSQEVEVVGAQDTVHFGRTRQMLLIPGPEQIQFACCEDLDPL